MRTLYVVIALLITLFFGRSATMAADNTAAADPFALLESTDANVRREAMQGIAVEHRETVDRLIAIVDEPRRDEGDGWRDESTTRNLAIELLGFMRDKRTVPHLVPHLEPPDGAQPSIQDERFHLCPAARALIDIGQPSVEPMIEILATTADPEQMRANQGRLVLQYVEGKIEGTRLLTEARKAEEDPQRQVALDANLEAFRAMRDFGPRP